MTEREFEELATRIRPELVRIATRRCGRDNAEDAVQMAVLYAWRDVQRGKRMTPAWLRHGTALQAIKVLRGLGRLRAAQKNLGVLGNKGCKQANTAPYFNRNEEVRQ